MSNNKINEITEKLSISMNRRNFIYSLSSKVSALVGITFITGSIIETGIINAQEQNDDPKTRTEAQPCEHPDDCSPNGLWGGSSGVLCKNWKINKRKGKKNKKDWNKEVVDGNGNKIPACPACTFDDNGCPKGTKKDLAWQACILCKNDPTKGEIIIYWDCCGVLDKDCVECDRPRNGAGHIRDWAKDCQNESKACQIRVWCANGSVFNGSPYACTVVENTKVQCEGKK